MCGRLRVLDTAKAVVWLASSAGFAGGIAVHTLSLPAIVKPPSTAVDTIRTVQPTIHCSICLKESLPIRAVAFEVFLFHLKA